MSGRLINGIKYMYINDDNDFKKKSLYDNVYFTLRDIFCNCNSLDTCFQANDYNSLLTNNIYFEDRTEKFRYTNVLYEKDYVERLQSWLKHFNIHYFEFEEPEEDEEIDMKEYMKWDDWWVQFINLKQLIDEQYKKYCKWEEEDVGRDCDRLAELAYEDECYAKGVDPFFGEEILDGGPGSYPEND